MPLSKKYYIEIADILCQAKTYYKSPKYKSAKGIEAVDRITEDLSGMFKEDNPRFDKTKFVKAAQCHIK